MTKFDLWMKAIKSKEMNKSQITSRINQLNSTDSFTEEEYNELISTINRVYK